MRTFVQQHEGFVTGVLHGWDRLLFRGTLGMLGGAAGMAQFLWLSQVLLKDFGTFALNLSERVRDASLALAAAAGREPVYLRSPGVDKQALAKEIAQRDGVTQGLAAVLTAVEPCWAYQVVGNRQTKKKELVRAYRKCLHIYFYWIDPMFGWMHARLQTWLPLTLRVCINGREWLARQMDHAGVGYVRKDNCFTALDDVEAAQRLSDAQLQTNWPAALDALVPRISPAHQQVFAEAPMSYYWSLDESEYASDVMFNDRGTLAALHRRLLLQGITTLGSGQVMRFLGKRVTATGNVDGRFTGEVVSDLRRRAEGVRIKHWINHNSVKMYDKHGTVLRVETTINQPDDLKVYRAKTGGDEKDKSWLPMRKGVADTHRRAQVSRACNERYYEALGAMKSGQTLGQTAAPVCRRVKWKSRPHRALNPLADADHRLLAAVADGKFIVTGFRNGDLQALLYGSEARDATERRRRSSAITRQIRLLRAHGLIRKVPRSHRYMVSARGRVIVNALLSARQADTETLINKAA
jgi:hypothetical protein